MSKENKKLVVISGPTAIGKTDYCIKLSQLLNTDTISADSRQIYKEMSIGTAKPNLEEIKSGRIKLVDHVSIQDEYNAYDFEKEALREIEKTLINSDFCILSGGTGLYIKAVLEGLDEFPKIDNDIIKEVEQKEIAELNQFIKANDPYLYDKIDLKNKRRLVRFASVIKSTGRPYSSFINRPKKERSFSACLIQLVMPREQLYDRINERVHSMIKSGLIEEVRNLLDCRSFRALQTVGYKEVFAYLDGHLTLEDCIAEIQKNTRRYAKRQMTWNRNQLDHKLIIDPRDSDSFDKVISTINT